MPNRTIRSSLNNASVDPPMVSLPSEITALDAFVYRVPLDTPRVNAFGRMTHRPALVVRLRDKDGAEGWGECFCNWPSFAAEHRYRVITEILQPLVAGKTFPSPLDLTRHLTANTRSIRIQSDERGPFDQSIAAVDIAAWDLAAHHLGIPLYKALGGTSGVHSVPIYASGLAPGMAAETASREHQRGVRAFKLKVGFGLETDLRELSAVREVIGRESKFMVDANQGWTPSEAAEAINAIKDFDLDWVEEPIPADSSPEEFRALSTIGIPIACGENIRGREAFTEMMTQGGLSVVQPDIIKWGGISNCYGVAQEALSRDLRYCPHYLGGGIGLMATIHLLIAIGGDGVMELDATTNPLRRLLAHPFPVFRNGAVTLSHNPGLGVAPNLDALDKFRYQVT